MSFEGMQMMLQADAADESIMFIRCHVQALVVMLNLATFQTAHSFCLDVLLTFDDKAQSKLIIGGASKTSTKSVKRPAGRTFKSSPSF